MAGFDIGAIGLRSRVTCPFDPVHVMNFSKFHSHIVKCRKRFPNDKRKPCPYNFSEFIDPEKMAEHVEECPYRLDYGTKSKVHVDNSRCIDAPYNVKFGKNFLTSWSRVNSHTKTLLIFYAGPVDKGRSHRPMDMDSYRDPRCKAESDYLSDCLDLDEEIDSVSVIAERRARNAKEDDSARSILYDNRSNITDTSRLGSGSGQSINLGRGRAAYFKRLMARSSQDTLSASQNKDMDEGFSFLCKANIYPNGEETQNSQLNSLPSSSSKPSVEDERLAFLKKLQDDVEEEYRHKKPRGRGMLFRPS